MSVLGHERTNALQQRTSALMSLGGLPIVIDGKVVGAIGASGGSGSEDTQVAQAGVAGLK
jgi:uncharacterized protein GlcG (DUF336 family)